MEKSIKELKEDLFDSKLEESRSRKSMEFNLERIKLIEERLKDLEIKNTY